MISIDREMLWQWDYGQRVQLHDVPVGTKVHFSNAAIKPNALVTEAYEDGDGVYANIPNILLQTAGTLTAYIYLEDGDEGHTEYRKMFIVRDREKPDDYVYTEDEVKTWEVLEERIKALEENGGGGVSPDELTAAVDAALTEAKESGLFDGAPGKDGQDGAPGKDGQDGAPGKDGDDYVLTEADKREIAGMVEVPSGGGGSESTWRRIRTVTIPEDFTTDNSGVTWTVMADGISANYHFDTDENGKPFQLKEIMWETENAHASDGSPYCQLTLTQQNNRMLITQSERTTNRRFGQGRLSLEGDVIEYYYLQQNTGSGGQSSMSNAETSAHYNYTKNVTPKGYIDRIGMRDNNKTVGWLPGSTWTFWGRDA